MFSELFHKLAKGAEKSLKATPIWYTEKTLLKIQNYTMDGNSIIPQKNKLTESNKDMFLQKFGNSELQHKAINYYGLEMIFVG